MPRACASSRRRRCSRSERGGEPLSARPVAFVWHPACLRHENGPAHPERPERLAAIKARAEKTGLPASLVENVPAPCRRDSIAGVQASEYDENIRRACARGPLLLDPDTGVVPASWDAALLSAGGAVAACDAVMAGRAAAAFVATRPPGH